MSEDRNYKRSFEIEVAKLRKIPVDTFAWLDQMERIDTVLDKYNETQKTP